MGEGWETGDDKEKRIYASIDHDTLARTSNTASTISQCQGRSFFVVMRISSIYMKSSVGYLLQREQNIFAMVLQKVVGELVRLKNMMHGWNSPRGFLKVAFHLLLSLIQMFSYPQQMSNLVKSSFPWRWSKMVLMRGKGYLSLIVQEFNTW